MVTALDAKRLRMGAHGKGLASSTTAAGLQEQIEALGDDIAAMQSLDDLGSPEANDRADRDMRSLQDKRDRLQRQLDRMRKKK